MFGYTSLDFWILYWNVFGLKLAKVRQKIVTVNNECHVRLGYTFC